MALSKETFDKAKVPKSKTWDVGKLLVEKYKMQDGPATLTVAATDDVLLKKRGQTRHSPFLPIAKKGNDGSGPFFSVPCFV